MRERYRVLLLMAVVGAVAVAAQGLSMWQLYSKELAGTRQEMEYVARTQARMVELRAAHSLEHNPRMPAAQLERQALEFYRESIGAGDRFGDSGEVNVGVERDGSVHYLTNLRFADEVRTGLLRLGPRVAAWHALEGKTGSIVTRDYRGRSVVAGFAPIPTLKAGLVAKLDLREVQAPFLDGALRGIASIMLLVGLGTWFFLRLTRPAELQLKASEKLYRELLGSISLPVLALAADSRIQFCNPAFMRTIAGGGNPADVLGRKVHEVWPAFLQTQSFKAYAEVLRTGKAAYVEAPLGPRFFEAHIVRTPSGALGIAEDVTERRERDRQNQLLASIVQSADDAIVAAGLDGKVTAWNVGAQMIYGYTAEEMLGQPWSKVIPEDRSAEHDLLVARISSGELVRNFETERIRKDGRRISISLSVSPILDASGHVAGISATSHDITRRKQVEQELEDMRASEAELQAIQRTAGAAAHEINNPLTGVTMLLELLLDNRRAAQDEICADDVELLQQALEQARRIKHALAQLQDVSTPRYREYHGGRQILDLSREPRREARRHS
jgi:PAS domain S-box-containing protein